ncbi:hypothetical protein AaE_009260 [Aphanomyces astaci]|uniref:DDE-1 domain-containing protein n=1 Tax=Aphanomyces astaci TaxID=112090 RepID=A0A6A5A8U3_APHAT|nr:hypothetical protein AaE_009260 [Aphanomyces astaci]
MAMFSTSIPPSIKRSVLMIVDGCSSHYSEHIYDAATSLGILLELLPVTTTHLFQPLNMTVYRPFKQAIRNQIADLCCIDVSFNISKQDAINIVCHVWATANDTNQSPITTVDFQAR